MEASDDSKTGTSEPFGVMTDYVYNGNLSDVFDFPSQIDMFLCRYLFLSDLSLFRFARILWNPLSVSYVLASQILDGNPWKQVMTIRQGHQNHLMVMIYQVYNGNLSDVSVFQVDSSF